MLVKEVVALAAENLGREDLAAESRAVTAEPVGELASLLRCYNLVENELALDYFPLKRTERFSVTDGKVYFTLFSLAPVEILGVSLNGSEAAYELYPEYLAIPSLAEGEADVTYAYSPAEKGWGETSSFSGRISPRLISFGIAGEFCLSRGKFSEAAAWEKRYHDAIRAAAITHGKKRMRSRRWV